MKILSVLSVVLILLTGCNKETTSVQPQTTTPTSSARIKAIIKASPNLTIDIYRITNSTLLSTIVIKSGNVDNVLSDDFVVAQDGNGNSIYYNLDLVVRYIPFTQSQRLELYF